MIRCCCCCWLVGLVGAQLIGRWLSRPNNNKIMASFGDMSQALFFFLNMCGCLNGFNWGGAVSEGGFVLEGQLAILKL